MGILSEEIQRVFCIKQPSSPPSSPDGTAFIMTAPGRRFLAAARHVVFDENKAQVVVPEVYRFDCWSTISTTAAVVITSSRDDDIAVFPLDEPSVDNKDESVAKFGGDVVLGDAALIAGFPYGCHRASEKTNSGCPLAIVKEVLIGGVVFGHKGIPSTAIILDGGMPEGFSGSPIWGRARRDISSAADPARVLGVVTQNVLNEEHPNRNPELSVGAHSVIPWSMILEFIGGPSRDMMIDGPKWTTRQRQDV